MIEYKCNTAPSYYAYTACFFNACAMLISVLSLLSLSTHTQVIKGYRETEKSQWRSQINQSVILRLQKATLQLNNDSNTISENSIDRHLLPHVHVLDLAKDG